jgi:hypothetical protein
LTLYVVGAWTPAAAAAAPLVWPGYLEFLLLLLILMQACQLPISAPAVLPSNFQVLLLLLLYRAVRAAAPAGAVLGLAPHGPDGGKRMTAAAPARRGACRAHGCV